ncbi:hypothetical protein QR77_28235 [Streptomyces sp. 150FB]|nr:hypothetical protein QR77_28235 [Streptomyces sp. 150FB]
MGWLKRRRSSDRGPRLIYLTTEAQEAAQARAAEAGLKPGYGSLKKGEGSYIIFQGSDTEKAKRYLLDLPPVEEELFYYVVETPDGNWGRDIDGLYLEKLRPWQSDTSAAECTAGIIALSGGLNGLGMAASGRCDNFVAKVACGKCAHEWYDGVRYRNLTAVCCPGCEALNRVDTLDIVVS